MDSKQELTGLDCKSAEESERKEEVQKEKVV